MCRLERKKDATYLYIVSERERMEDRMVRQWASVCCPQLCFPFRDNSGMLSQLLSACASVVRIWYIAKVSLQMERMLDENFIFDLASLSLVWFFFARLCLFWNCCHFANSCVCAYLIRFMHWTISRKKKSSKSPNDVKCGELKFIYFKETTLIVKVRAQANTHLMLGC